MNAFTRSTRVIALASAIALSADVASAANITTFSQTSGSNTVTATTDAGNTQTTLSVVDAALSIGQFIGGVPPLSLFSFSATSFDAAQTIGSAVIQHFNGSFCITTLAGCTGTNVLSGTFSDAAFGAQGGPGLAVNTNNPPDTLTLSSDIIPASDLNAPNTFTLAFSNLTPVLGIVGTTIAPFTASLAGDVSATSVTIPEPGSLAVLAIGVAGVALAKRRRYSI